MSMPKPFDSLFGLKITDSWSPKFLLRTHLAKKMSPIAKARVAAMPTEIPAICAVLRGGPRLPLSAGGVGAEAPVVVTLPGDVDELVVIAGVMLTVCEADVGAKVCDELAVGEAPGT